ncbi:hypothetical protein OG21DRAFT_947459 [Imleria badia]|nr:hypothetical protein OG21DRAFT_947459 [Imleria badia]
MSHTPLIPPLPPLPATVSGSKSTRSVNGTKPDSSQTRTRQMALTRSPARTVWTLALVGNREEIGRQKEMRRAEKERGLQGVIAGVWEELSADRARAGGGVPVPLASVPVGCAGGGSKYGQGVGCSEAARLHHRIRPLLTIPLILSTTDIRTPKVA